jgi:hypothetical protein
VAGAGEVAGATDSAGAAVVDGEADAAGAAVATGAGVAGDAAAGAAAGEAAAAGAGDCWGANKDVPLAGGASGGSGDSSGKNWGKGGICASVGGWRDDEAQELMAAGEDKIVAPQAADPLRPPRLI